MWTQIGVNDAAGLARQVTIMWPAVRLFANILALVFVASIKKQQGELWHYQGDGFEIGVLFQYSGVRTHWQLARLGVTGDVQAAQAEGILALQLRDFLRKHGASSVFTVPVNATEDRSLAALYNACVADPNLSIRLVSRNEINSLWEINYVGP
jgi:hypothetical protein